MSECKFSDYINMLLGKSNSEEIRELADPLPKRMTEEELQKKHDELAEWEADLVVQSKLVEIELEGARKTQEINRKIRGNIFKSVEKELTERCDKLLIAERELMDLVCRLLPGFVRDKSQTIHDQLEFIVSEVERRYNIGREKKDE